MLTPDSSVVLPCSISSSRDHRVYCTSFPQYGQLLADEETAAANISFKGNILKGHLRRTQKITNMQLEAQLRLCQSCLWCCRSGLRQLSQRYANRKTANYYELLGVKSDASLEEIKNSFFEKSKKLHPDSDPSNPALHNQFVELNEAYRVLSKTLSRKEYDFKIRHPYSGDQAFASSSSYSSYRPSMDNQENMRYWQQFHQSYAQETTAEERQQRKRRNIRLVGYCVITIVLSIGAHKVFFRKLEEVHNNFMDGKDQVITEIYNKSKERARVNGFKKQTEILKQKHAEFLEKYKICNNGVDK